MHLLFKAVWEALLDLPPHEIIFLLAMVVLILFCLIDGLIIIPVFYFTVGRKFDRLLGKREVPVFAALSMANLTISAGRHYFYQWTLVDKKLRGRRLYQEIYGDFDFIAHATRRDIRIAKTREIVERICVYSFLITVIAMLLPKIIAFFAKL